MLFGFWNRFACFCRSHGTSGFFDTFTVLWSFQRLLTLTWCFSSLMSSSLFRRFWNSTVICGLLQKIFNLSSLQLLSPTCDMRFWNFWRRFHVVWRWLSLLVRIFLLISLFLGFWNTSLRLLISFCPSASLLRGLCNGFQGFFRFVIFTGCWSFFFTFTRRWHWNLWNFSFRFRICFRASSTSFLSFWNNGFDFNLLFRGRDFFSFFGFLLQVFWNRIRFSWLFHGFLGLRSFGTPSTLLGFWNNSVNRFLFIFWVFSSRIVLVNYCSRFSLRWLFQYRLLLCGFLLTFRTFASLHFWFWNINLSFDRLQMILTSWLAFYGPLSLFPSFRGRRFIFGLVFNGISNFALLCFWNSRITFHFVCNLFLFFSLRFRPLSALLFLYGNRFLSLFWNLRDRIGSFVFQNLFFIFSGWFLSLATRFFNFWNSFFLFLDLLFCRLFLTSSTKFLRYWNGFLLFFKLFTFRGWFLSLATRFFNFWKSFFLFLNLLFSRLFLTPSTRLLGFWNRRIGFVLFHNFSKYSGFWNRFTFLLFSKIFSGWFFFTALRSRLFGFRCWIRFFPFASFPVVCSRRFHWRWISRLDAESFPLLVYFFFVHGQIERPFIRLAFIRFGIRFRMLLSVIWFLGFRHLRRIFRFSDRVCSSC